MKIKGGSVSRITNTRSTPIQLSCPSTLPSSSVYTVYNQTSVVFHLNRKMLIFGFQYPYLLKGPHA